MGSAGTQVLDNNTVIISPSTEDIWIRVEPEAINSGTNSGAFYKVELELAGTGLVDWAWVILNNEYTPVADPGPKVSLVRSCLCLVCDTCLIFTFVFILS